MMSDPGTGGFQSLPQNPGCVALAPSCGLHCLGTSPTVQEGTGGGNMHHQGKKLAGQKGEDRTEH